MFDKRSVGYFVQARTVTDAHLNAAADAFLADMEIGLFEVAPGCRVDLTAAVKASRHVMATLKEPTAKAGSKRAAVKTAILLARLA